MSKDTGQHTEGLEMEVKGRYSYSSKRVREDAEAIRASGASFIIKGFHRTMWGGSVVDTPFMCRVDEIPEWFASTGSLLVYDDITRFRVW